MAKASKTLWLVGACAFALSSNAFAQGAGAVTLALQNFDLAGAGCPAKSATKVTLTTDMSGRQAARIEFGQPNAMVPAAGAPAPAMTAPAAPAPAAAMGAAPAAAFQVKGATAQSACAIALTIGISGAPTVDFAVSSAIANVSFANTGNQGQLSLMARFRVNNAQSPARTTRIGAAAPGAMAGAMAAMSGSPSNLTLNNLNVNSEVKGTATVSANLQLQTMGAAADANVSLNSVLVVFDVKPDIGG